ncbi:MAG: hypothetical protein ABFD52_08845 [Acidobacteriota bacterium]
MTQITADFSGAIRQTATLLKLNRAHKFVATEWASDTVRILKMRARAMQKSISPWKKKTGQLARNIDKLVGAEEDRWTVVVGTGIGGTQSVRYAKIQDEGGTTHPRVTKRMRRWAWFMFKETGNEMYRGIALTSKKKLDVKIPETKWFSGVLEYRERDLSEMMDPDHVLKVAQGMAGVK